MKKKAGVRRVFPGSNSTYGFYSFFEQIAGPGADRVFIIKGGPGSGKSTFMHKIGREMQEQGLAVEYHHCASDHESLDGLVVPALGVAFMDGTYPHIIDPHYPGVIEEIVHLGQFWDETGLRENKTQIIKLVAETAQFFKHTYRILAAARFYLEGLDSYDNLAGVLDQGAWNSLALQLIEELLPGKKHGPLPGGARKLFASAISPGGTVNYLDTLVESLEKVYILHGNNGTAKGNLLGRVADAALARGFYIEAYHCAFDPHRLDHLIIPELETAIINSMEPHYFTLPAARQEIDTAGFSAELARPLQDEKQFFREKYQGALSGAVAFLAKAKAAHDELERLYVPCIDFTGIEKLRLEILRRIV